MELHSACRRHWQTLNDSSDPLNGYKTRAPAPSIDTLVVLQHESQQQSTSSIWLLPMCSETMELLWQIWGNPYILEKAGSSLSFSRFQNFVKKLVTFFQDWEKVLHFKVLWAPNSDWENFANMAKNSGSQTCWFNVASLKKPQKYRNTWKIAHNFSPESRRFLVIANTDPE